MYVVAGFKPALFYVPFVWLDSHCLTDFAV